jgi:HNH endonuclease
MTVSKSLRYEILRRDGYACRYCGATPPDVTLEVDHVVPVTLGGLDIPENLVAACRDCNAGKSASPTDGALIANVAEDAIRWRKAMEVAQEMAIRESAVNEVLAKDFYEYWNSFTYFVPNYRTGTGKAENRVFELPHDWNTTINKLVADGTFRAELMDAVSIAMARTRIDDKFAYFVGVVRGKLRDRQLVAQDLIQRGEV